jgi:type IV secretory pathway VirD2 relaxase
MVASWLPWISASMVAAKRQRRSKIVQTRSQARGALKELHRLKDAGVDLVGAYTTLEAFLDRWYATLRRLAYAPASRTEAPSMSELR